MNRSSGVLMHISTLFGDYSEGSFGRNALKFIDFLSDCGFGYWQTLPFCMTDEYNSPYKSYSAFSFNPMFIDIELLFEKGYITKAELDTARQNTPFACEFDRLWKERYPLLRTASQRAPLDDAEKFVNEHIHIRRFCEFMALREANGGKPWQEWTVNVYDRDIFLFWAFTQWEFFFQWTEVKKYANSKGIRIIGDMPMFVDLDSSDVYFERELFMLDRENKPQCVAGVPPDYFSADGQVWGNPLYNWKEMQKQNFSWWHDRLEQMLTLFDGVRIDHFRGFDACFSIPYGEKTAKNGKWVKAKGKQMLDAVRDVTEGKLVIAEDLGDITDSVERLVKYSGFPGMRVMQFGFLSKEDTTHRCHNYINNSVAYTGTHDNNTLLGYVWEMSEEDRRFLFDYCGYEGDIHGCYDSIIRTLFASSAGLVMLPIQDLLLFGSDTRINTPGRAKGNWSFRITEENLVGVDRERYRHLNEMYGRFNRVDK